MSEEAAAEAAKKAEKIAREADDIAKEAAQATGSAYRKGALSTDVERLKTALGKWLTWLRK